MRRAAFSFVVISRAAPAVAAAFVCLAVLTLAAAVSGPAPASAQEKIPRNDGWVTDEAGFLTESQERALETLAPPERAAIALAFGQERTHQEVATILGCPLGTVKTHIARGKEKLAKRLKAWQPREAT